MSAYRLRRWTGAHVASAALGGLAIGVCGLAVGGCGAAAGANTSERLTASASSGAPPSSGVSPRSSPSGGASTQARRRSKRSQHRTSSPTRSDAAALTPRYAVGERVVTFVDSSRRVRFPGQRPEPRTLVTVIRYPARGPASRTDVPNATPDRSAGPLPLIVFGHGFAVTPGNYARLLAAWARAGYVVAAPIFPLENANAPGGPTESDIVNQPRDMRFVITQMLAASANPGSPLAGLIAPGQIAVSGQSDGGETALAVAYDRYYRDPRVRAAVILSGAQLYGAGLFDFPAPSPALLATQGTDDTINRPRDTYKFFRAAPRPKYLLKLLATQHLAPYTYEQPQLSMVERVTVAFLDRYLKGARDGLARMVAAGRVPGRSELIARP